MTEPLHPLVAICIVTHDSAEDLPDCLAAVGALEHRPLELVIVDCASRDGSLERAREAAPRDVPLQTIALPENRGFAGGMNVALARTAAPFVLSLNADARPRPDFVGRLLVRIETPLPGGARAAAVAGRLVRPPDGDRRGPPRLDACGMRLTLAWRHLDRGSGDLDRGQLAVPERVFGATGAASLFRREALLDAAVGGEVFDPRFHSFREDAELCFRLRERGWEVVYEPAAVAEHRRRVLPERRAALPAAVNFHSLKNRYLLRLYHQTAGNFLWTLPWTLARDLAALCWVLAAERSSLPAYAWLWRRRRELLARRREIQARRRVPPRAIGRWFLHAGLPLDAARASPGPAPRPEGTPQEQPPGGRGPVSARPPRVALLGSRGIPARYGGYETLMEELATRLVARGFDVTVYCRSHSTPRDLTSWRGARLAVLPTLRGKHLDTPVHTLLCCLHAAAAGYDAALVVNSANALFVPLLTAAGVPVALHVDGIEKRRAKWGAFGRAVYAVSERLACVVADALVTDAEVIRRHYLERYGVDSVPIAYGVEPRPPAEEGLLARLGLAHRRYFLYVSRFEPENHPHTVAAAYARAGGELPLVMVGGAPYAGEFIRSFTTGADPRILFPGPIYGEGYRELLAHALAYVHSTEVGGTHPALVEAMGYGNCVVVNDTPENREVAADAALYFRAREPESLTAALDRVRLDHHLSRTLGARAAARAARLYSWEAVTGRYADLFCRLGAETQRKPPQIR